MSSKTAHSFDSKKRSEDVKAAEDIQFSNLHLTKSVLEGLTKAGYCKPSPIQLEAVPIGKCGIDVVVQSKSGTGKTLVFGIVLLESLDMQVSTVQGLVLAPTREIAFQNAHVMYTIGSELPGLHVQVFIGGLPLETDQEKCKACHIAVGTPGRVKQLMEKGSLKPNTIRLFVLDEADKLMEESFAEDILWIFSQLPPSKQVMAVSATYPEALAGLVSRYMQNPAFVRLGHQQPTLLGVKQFVVSVPHHPMAQQQAKNKLDVLLQLLSSVQFDQCMIFTNLQTRAESLAAQLSSHGHAALSISGAQTQTKRLQTLLKLRQYQCKILVATDLAARGIDAEHIDLVVHMDVPHEPATYLHRVGRAGRFGASAITCTVACEGNELTELRSIVTRTRASIRQLTRDQLVLPDGGQRLSIAVLEQLWPSLSELEGTGLEGEGVADSLLADLEQGIQTPTDSSKALLPHRKRKKSRPRNKTKSAQKALARQVDPPPLEESVSRLTLKTADEVRTIPTVAPADLWEWYQSWMIHLAQNKAFIQQSEYIRMMTSKDDA